MQKAINHATPHDPEWFRQSEKVFATPAYYNRRRFEVIRTLGPRMDRNDRVLELGCGDGLLAESLLRYGVSYHGTDIEQKLLLATEARLKQADIQSNVTLSTCDVNALHIDDTYDVIVAWMRSFFSYSRDPKQVIRILRHHVRKKLVLDLDPSSPWLKPDGAQIHGQR